MRALIAGAVLALCAAVAAFAYADGARDASARERALAARLDSLAAAAARTDTVYLRDTVRLTRWRTQWDTVRQDVDRWKHDTIEVVRFVAVAESTITACTDALRTCEARVAVRDSALAVWQVRWDTRAKPPSAVRVWGERLVVFGAAWWLRGTAR